MGIGTQLLNWDQLAERLQAEEAILGSRNSPASLRTIYKKGMTALKTGKNKSEIIAFGAWWPTANPRYVELGSLWVHKPYRSRRLASVVFTELMSKLAPCQEAICITHNPRVIHLLERSAWDQVSREDWFSVVPFSVSCGPCGTISDNLKQGCPQRARIGKCLMYFYENDLVPCRPFAF